jgi:hypothetical protein
MNRQLDFFNTLKLLWGLEELLCNSRILVQRLLEWLCTRGLWRTKIRGLCTEIQLLYAITRRKGWLPNTFSNSRTRFGVARCPRKGLSGVRFLLLSECNRVSLRIRNR